MIAWEKRLYPVDHLPFNEVRLVAPDAAGNTFYAGFGWDDDPTVAWVNKLDPAGALVWAYDLAVGPAITVPTDMITDKSGRVVVGGGTGRYYSRPEGGGSVAKLSASTGQPVWIRSLSTPRNDFVARIALDPNEYIFAAMNGALVKLKPSGAIAWQVDAAAQLLRVNAKGEAIIAGQDSAGANWLAKWLSSGRLAWKKRLTGKAASIILDPKGNIIVGYGGVIAKYSDDGNIQWKRQQAVIGDISTDGRSDLYAMTGKNNLSKFSGVDGGLLWTITRDVPDDYEYMSLLRADSAGASIVYGQGCCYDDHWGDREYYWVAKYDTNGTLMWSQSAASSAEYFDEVSVARAALHRSGAVFLSVSTEVSDGTADGAWAVKFEVIP